ncbi:MAG: membrane protein insertion efficiency factor YidD [Desulfobacterales bacterium]|nr:membrane protein insertion efficiency factor YidD [Desulfobacterales bacterium]
MKRNFSIKRLVFLFLTVLLLPGSVAYGQESESSPALFSLSLFRKYISPVDGSRCPMYPTDSKYSMEVFKKHGFAIGLMMTADRLMRCGRDETRLSPKVWVDNENRTYDPVSNNDFWWTDK